MARVVVGKCGACGADLRVKDHAVAASLHLTCRCGHHQDVQVDPQQVSDGGDETAMITWAVAILVNLLLLLLVGGVFLWGNRSDRVGSLFGVFDWGVYLALIAAFLLVIIGVDWSDSRSTSGNITTVLVGSGFVRGLAVLAVVFYPLAALSHAAPNPWANETVRVWTGGALLAGVLASTVTSLSRSWGKGAGQMLRCTLAAVFLSPGIVLFPAYCLALSTCFSWYFFSAGKGGLLQRSYVLLVAAVVVLLVAVVLITVAVLFGMGLSASTAKEKESA